MQHHYITEVCRNVLRTRESFHESDASEMTSATCKRAIASIAAKRLVNRVLHLRKLMLVPCLSQYGQLPRK